MADDYYFGGSDSKIGVMVQTSFFDPDPDAADTAPTWASGKKIGAVEGWTFKITGDYKELFAMDSTKRLAVARCNVRVEGKLNFCKFDPTIGTWWVMKIPNSAGGGTVADTSKHTYFMLWGSLSPFGNGSILGAKVYNAFFSSMPLSASANDWIAVDLSFTASHLDFVNAAPTFA